MDYSRSNRGSCRERSQMQCPGRRGMPSNFDISPKREMQECPSIDCPSLAMAYVPVQKFTRMFDLTKGLHMGTIFPELCLPFCGKRGGCR